MTIESEEEAVEALNGGGQAQTLKQKEENIPLPTSTPNQVRMTIESEEEVVEALIMVVGKLIAAHGSALDPVNQPCTLHPKPQTRNHAARDHHFHRNPPLQTGTPKP